MKSININELFDELRVNKDMNTTFTITADEARVLLNGEYEDHFRIGPFIFIVK